MPKTRLPYSPEFRRQIVDLVRAGRDPSDLAREFEPSAQAIRNWVNLRRFGGHPEARFEAEVFDGEAGNRVAGVEAAVLHGRV